MLLGDQDEPWLGGPEGLNTTLHLHLCVADTWTYSK